MQTPSEKTKRMLLMRTEKEVFEIAVDKDHPFRVLNAIINWEELVDPEHGKPVGATPYTWITTEGYRGLWESWVKRFSSFPLAGEGQDVGNA